MLSSQFATLDGFTFSEGLSVDEVKFPSLFNPGDLLFCDAVLRRTARDRFDEVVASLGA